MRRKDHYYYKAQREGYRSRAVFKLRQLNNRFGIFTGAKTVLDLCCAPGGWLQIAKEELGEEGIVVGVDINRILDIDGVTFVYGDILEEETLNRVLSVCSEFDVILSDCSPNVSGIWSVDHERQIFLARASLNIAKRALKDGGTLVIKAFQGSEYPNFLKEVQKCFGFVRTTKPSASRKSSAEMYIVAKNFRKK
ncbi:MAG: RlmE family RNA methyltransferase [Candidatus Jordarchaeum sp.]|uniref:RlmE family RNA methyltransferase n=1 Tax=Candidatus Jordarchaeum sp. TaxID=2823881 RepID=UPI004049CAAB